MAAASAPEPMVSEGSNFEVVIEKPPGTDFEVIPEEKEEDEIKPDHYYEDGGIPVFKPTMDQFRSFKDFVNKINHYGMRSGIIKIVPPPEWYETLAPLEEKVKDIRIKNPIVQHIAGMQGEYRQENVEKQRTYNLPQWRQLCEGSEHQPPARRGERRKGQVAKEATVGRKTRSSRKSAAADKEERDEEDIEEAQEATVPTNARKKNPPTPKSPEKRQEEAGSPKPVTDLHGRQPRASVGAEETPEPVTDSHGRQPRQRKKYIRKTAKAREAEQAMLDDEAFDGFDYRITNADEYTPERCEELEKAYWRTLTYSNPLYGADMPGSLFDDMTTSWNVAHLENLLDCLGKKLPGVNTAYLYLGMWRSTFAWHLEDMDLYSINYIHFGAPKQWYSISRSDKHKFEEVMKRTWPNDSKKCTEFLRHKSFLVSPSLLASHGIKVNRVVHHQGEFIITFPYGYHSGYNLGYNCAESVNFATESWLDYGRSAKKCECIKDSVWIDVAEIERKLRGESTEDEYEEVEYYGGYDDDDDEELEEESMDLPTPPESVEGKPVKPKSRPRKRKVLEDGVEMPIKIKRLKLKFSKTAPEPEPCILCPNNIPTEELVATDVDGQNAHRLCAIYTPETFFSWNPIAQKEIIANVDGIPKARLELKCVFCRSKKGACFQCSSKKCTRAYHATCAAAAGVLVNMVDVPVFGEDGQYYTRTEIDFRCRFHRPKRPKDMDGEKLENDPLIRTFAGHLLKGDVIQMQYFRGEIFAGVVVENRRSEEMVLVEVLPKGDKIEVEWKWILAQDPSMIQMPEPLTEMPLNPTPQQAGIATRRVPKEIPDIDDPFCDPGSGLKWAELVIEQPTFLSEQVAVNFNKPFWHYLGELSTEYISKYSDDPRKRIPNEAANMIPSRKAKPKRQSQQQPKAIFNIQDSNSSSRGPLPYQQGHQQGHQELLQHHLQQQMTAYHHQQQQQSKGQGYHRPGYRAPVAPMGQMPQQQLWPPIYRPPAGTPSVQSGTQKQRVATPTMQGAATHATPAAAGQYAGIIIDQRRAEYVAAAALSASPQHVHGPSNEAPKLTAQVMANGTPIPVPSETGTNGQPTSPAIRKTSSNISQHPAKTSQKTSSPQTPKVLVNVPVPPPITPFQPNGNNMFATAPAPPPPQMVAPAPAPQPQLKGSGELSTPPQPKLTPTKVVPLADIQAALAILTKAKAKAEAKAEAEARERLQAQAQAAQAQATAAPAPPPPPSQAA